MKSSSSLYSDFTILVIFVGDTKRIRILYFQKLFIVLSFHA